MKLISQQNMPTENHLSQICVHLPAWGTYGYLTAGGLQLQKIRESIKLRRWVIYMTRLLGQQIWSVGYAMKLCDSVAGATGVITGTAECMVGQRMSVRRKYTRQCGPMSSIRMNVGVVLFLFSASKCCRGM